MENKTKKTYTEEKKIAQPPEKPQTNTNKNNLSIAALVVGIVSLFLCYVPVFGLILGIIAITLGIIGIKKASDKGMSIVGIVTGGISSLINLFMILIVVIGIISFRGVVSDIESRNSNQNSSINTEFKKGEVATFGDLEVKVNSIIRNYTLKNDSYSINEGKELVVVNIDVKNISKKPVDFKSEDIRLNADGVTNSTNLMSVEPIIAEGQISSGITTTGNIVYEIKKNASNLRLQYEAPNYAIPFTYDTENIIYTLDI